MDFDPEPYLRRIGLRVASSADLSYLRLLHRRHQHSVPFENLDIVRGIPLTLDREQLLRKIVVERRGGFCYELNSLFAKLLEALGYRVSLLSARVFDAGGIAGPPFDHLTLRVDLEEPWLCDVGFGRAFAEPLPLRELDEWSDPAGRFALRRQKQTWTLRAFGSDVHFQGPQWRDLYLFDLAPRRLAEFEEMFRYHQSSPDSIFTRMLICSLARERGRITLRDLERIETCDGIQTRSTLSSAAERDALLAEEFGLRL